MVKAVLKGWDLWVAVAGALLVSMSFECSGVIYRKKYRQIICVRKKEGER